MKFADAPNTQLRELKGNLHGQDLPKQLAALKTAVALHEKNATRRATFVTMAECNGSHVPIKHPPFPMEPVPFSKSSGYLPWVARVMTSQGTGDVPKFQ